jgi:hypothetical protein
VKDSRDPVVKGTFRVSAATSKKSLKIVEKSKKCMYRVRGEETYLS